MRDYVKPTKSARKLIVQRRKITSRRDVARVVAVRRSNSQSEKFMAR